MNQTRSPQTTIFDAVLLAIGFVALAGAAVVAHTNPATGYELSPYTSTSGVFWLLFGCSMFVSLVVSLRSTTVWNRRLALGLGGGAMTTFVALPILRGYRFYGSGDALTHLGWMRGIRSGTFAPTELEYPALHVMSNLIGAALGIDLSHAALLVVVALSALFFLFVALSTSIVFESRHSATIGAFSAFLVLPITTLSTHMVPHAMSQAILFSTVLVFLSLRYARDPGTSRTASALGALFAITSIALVFYHPQLVAHLLVVFLGICVLQYLHRRRETSHPISEHRPLYAQTTVLLGAFLVWTSRHGFFAGSIEHATSSALAYFVGDGTAGERVDTQGAALAELGGSMIEVFLKLFGSSMVFILLTGFLVLWSIRELGGPLTRETNGFVPYFAVGLTGLSGIFALYYFASYAEMHFRVLGLMLLLITIAGAVAIAYGATACSGLQWTPTVQGIVAFAFAILLLVSLLAVFPSPYIYSASPHVTDKSLEGHQTAFDDGDPEVTYVGIRAGPNRYADASHDELDRNRHYEGLTSDEIDDGVAGQFDDDRYLTLTQLDYDREVDAYQELRYSQEQLDSIGTQPGVDRVQTNGEFELYYIRGTAAEEDD